MTDKELFEKNEKVFNIKREKNILIEKVYSKGNFKDLLENTSPIKSNYGDNTVSAARAAGRGAATVGGAIGKGLGALGRGVAGMFSGTKTARKKEAEEREAEAQARQAQTQAQQAQSNLIGGTGKNGSQSKPKEGTQERDRYENDSRYRRVWNAYANGDEKDLSKADIEHYETVNKSIKDAELATASQAAATDAAAEEKKKLRAKDILEFENSIKLNAPGTATALNDKGQLGFYTSFMHGEEVAEKDLLATAMTINNSIEFDKKELDGIRRIIKGNAKLTSGARESFLNNLHTQATKRPTEPVETKKPKPTAAQILNKKILKSAKNNNRSKAEQIRFQNEKAKEEFKVGDSVKSTLQGKGDILFDVVGFDTKTGTVIVKTTGKTPRSLRKLPGEIEPLTFKLKPENKDEMKDTIKKAMSESFEQTVKRYR